jgi:hypothetical protein
MVWLHLSFNRFVGAVLIITGLHIFPWKGIFLKRNTGQKNTGDNRTVSAAWNNAGGTNAR